MSKTDGMSKTGKYCPFQPPIKESNYTIEDGTWKTDDIYHWQECGEVCALYSTKLQDCVFGIIADRMGDIAEQLDDIAESAEGMIE